MKEVATTVNRVREGKTQNGNFQCEKMERDFVKLIDRITEIYDLLKVKRGTDVAWAQSSIFNLCL